VTSTDAPSLLNIPAPLVNMSPDEFLEIINNLAMRSAQLRSERDRWRSEATDADRRARELEARVAEMNPAE
jgi:hypothetical protein